jgi:hypothetical protein
MWIGLRLAARAGLGGPSSGCHAFLGACVALACALRAGEAAADGPIRLAVDREKLGVLLHSEDATPPPYWRPEADRAVVKAAAAHTESRSLFDGALGPGRWSLVARDWEAARLLMGRLAATDEVKRGRSKRMIVLRGRLVEGPITPFAQLGLGQWRFDPDMPAMPHNALIAAQLGVGVEYVVASWVSIALEADCTLLDPGRLEASNPQPREGPDPEPRWRGDRWVHPPALWGSFLAAYARF